MIALQREAVLLNLLKVIGHHRGRLAIPICTLQKIYNEAEIEDLPFADTIFSRSRAAANRPLLLIEPPYKINGDDKIKASTHANEEKYSVEEATLISNSKASAKFGSTSTIDSNVDKATESSTINSSSSSKVSISEAQSRNPLPGDSVEELTSSGRVVNTEKSAGAKPQSANEEFKIPFGISLAKQDVDKKSPVTMPSLEENIVLGGALEGSKLTLPIGEETSTESKESSAHQSGSGSHLVDKDKKDGQLPAVHGGNPNN